MIWKRFYLEVGDLLVAMQQTHFLMASVKAAGTELSKFSYKK